MVLYFLIQLSLYFDSFKFILFIAIVYHRSTSICFATFIHYFLIVHNSITAFKFVIIMKTKPLTLYIITVWKINIFN